MSPVLLGLYMFQVVHCSVTTVDIYDRIFPNSEWIVESKSEESGLPTNLFTAQAFLQRGGYSVVYAMTDVSTRQRVAVKVVSKVQMQRELGGYWFIQQEVAIHEDLRHPNIVELFRVLESNSHVFLVMELCEGGDLFHKVMAVQPPLMSEPETMILMNQLVDAVKYLHTAQIVHKDIKLENILFTKGGIVKLADFGLSENRVTADPDGEPEIMGSPYYLAPELWRQHPYAHGVDVYALGVVLYRLLVGRFPFLNQREAVKGLIELPLFVSAEARGLLSAMLNPNKNLRIDICAVQSHRWFVAEASDESLRKSRSSSCEFELTADIPAVPSESRATTPADGISLTSTPVMGQTKS